MGQKQSDLLNLEGTKAQRCSSPRGPGKSHFRTAWAPPSASMGQASLHESRATCPLRQRHYQEARDVSEGGGCRHEDGHRPVTPVTHAVIEVPAGGEGAGLRPPPAGNQDGSSLGPGPGPCPLRKDITVPLVISQACSGLVVGTWACQGHKEEDKSP